MKFSPARDERKWGNVRTRVSVDRDANLRCVGRLLSPLRRFRTYPQLPSDKIAGLDVRLRDIPVGFGLESALAFCSYLRNSGIIGLLKEHSREGPPAVNGPLICWKVGEVERQARYRLRVGGSGVAMSELKAINRKLDLIAGHVSRIETSCGGANCSRTSRASKRSLISRSCRSIKRATMPTAGRNTASMSKTASESLRKNNVTSGSNNALTAISGATGMPVGCAGLAVGNQRWSSVDSETNKRARRVLSPCVKMPMLL
jgi:hypothetical protein